MVTLVFFRVPLNRLSHVFIANCMQATTTYKSIYRFARLNKSLQNILKLAKLQLFIHTFESGMFGTRLALTKVTLEKMGMSGKTPVGADVGNSAGHWGVEVVVGMRQGGS